MDAALGFLLIGLLIGAILAWIWARLRLQTHAVLKADLDQQFVRRELHEANER